MWRREEKRAAAAIEKPRNHARGALAGALTHYEASQLLQLSRLEFDALLKSRNIDEHAYDVEDLEQDLETLERLEARGLMRRS